MAFFISYPLIPSSLKSDASAQRSGVPKWLGCRNPSSRVSPWDGTRMTWGLWQQVAYGPGYPSRGGTSTRFCNGFQAQKPTLTWPFLVICAPTQQKTHFHDSVPMFISSNSLSLRSVIAKHHLQLESFFDGEPHTRYWLDPKQYTARNCCTRENTMKSGPLLMTHTVPQQLERISPLGQT